jgi:hypothetical protein
MKAGGEAQATRSQTGGHLIHGAGGRGWWRFVRRYLEMVAVMLVGMTVLA